jgi:hypothetical protein
VRTEEREGKLYAIKSTRTEQLSRGLRRDRDKRRPRWKKQPLRRHKIHRCGGPLAADHTRLRRLAELFFTALCPLPFPVTLNITRTLPRCLSCKPRNRAVADVVAAGNLAHRLAVLITAADHLALLVFGQFRPAALPLISVCAPTLPTLPRPAAASGRRNSTSMMLPHAPFIDTRFASPKV